MCFTLIKSQKSRSKIANLHSNVTFFPRNLWHIQSLSLSKVIRVLRINRKAVHDSAKVMWCAMFSVHLTIEMVFEKWYIYIIQSVQLHTGSIEKMFKNTYFSNGYFCLTYDIYISSSHLLIQFLTFRLKSVR